MNVIAVDPGKTTGIATWLEGEHCAWAEPFDKATATVHDRIAWARSAYKWRFDLVVFEGIVITGQTLKKSRDVQGAIEFIGVGRYLSRCYGVDFEVQTPSDAKGFSTDEKLAAMGWAMPGPGDHSRSASRHLLLALVKHRQIDLQQLVRAL